jgi:putative permease
MRQKLPLLHKMLIAFLFIGAFLAAGYAVRHTFSVLLLSFVLAYLFDPLVVFFEKRKMRRVYGILILYAFLCVFTIFCFIFLLPYFTIRWNSLLHDLPTYVHKLQNLITGWKDQVKLPYATDEWDWFLDTLQTNVDVAMSRLGAGVYSMAGIVAVNLFNALLSPILVFFMLFYKHDIIESARQWLPGSRRDLLLAIGRDINRSLGGFVRGQGVVSLIVAGLSALALIMLNVNHPFFCAIFAGIASVIPFVGVILATIPPLFFSYVEYQDPMLMLKIMIAFSVIYFLEGYIIKPIVFRESMDLNPLTTIIIVMAFGELMGFWGVILAIPAAASIKIISHHLRENDLLEQGS